MLYYGIKYFIIIIVYFYMLHYGITYNLELKVKVKLLSHVQLFGTPWTTYQAPLSMGFSRQEYWSGLPFPSMQFLWFTWKTSERIEFHTIWKHCLAFSPPSNASCMFFSLSSVSDFLQCRRLQQAMLTCPSLSPRVCLNSCPLRQSCHSTISSSVAPFSCSQSFPASGSFPMSWLFASGQVLELQY